LRRRFAATVVFAGALVATTLPSAAASAAPETTDIIPKAAAAAAPCSEINVGLTGKHGSVIRGSGSGKADCFGDHRIDVQLFRQRATGKQQLDKSTIWPGRGRGVEVNYNCSGDGTFTYWTEVSLYATGNVLRGRKVSNRIRVSC
jgi:hypothetical protein